MLMKWRQLSVSRAAFDGVQFSVVHFSVAGAGRAPYRVEIESSLLREPPPGHSFLTETAKRGLAPYRVVCQCPAESATKQSNVVGIDHQSRIVMLNRSPSSAYLKALCRGLITADVRSKNVYGVHSVALRTASHKGVLLIGPSGSGKSYFSATVQSEFGGEIISRDWSVLRFDRNTLLAHDLCYTEDEPNRTSVQVKSIFFLTPNAVHDTKPPPIVQIVGLVRESNQYVPPSTSLTGDDTDLKFWRRCSSKAPISIIHSRRMSVEQIVACVQESLV